MKGKDFPGKTFKAEGKIDSDSSEDKTDHLSYSYSCVKSFRKNQTIIGDLAGLYNRQDYQGNDHQPALYSLSGERNRPYSNTIYCSPALDSDSSEYEEERVVKLANNIPDNNVSTNNEAEPHPIKVLLYQWFKEQFKQVNSLWPLLPRVFKRNQNMKMEMTLNGVDKERKDKLIEYINKLNLTFEERCNLCTGNETVLEIDVTSIADDGERLQRFLSFLKSLEYGKSEIPSSKCEVKSNLLNPQSQERYDSVKKIGKVEKLDGKIIHRRTSKYHVDRGCQISISSSTSSESNESMKGKLKQGKKKARQITTISGTNGQGLVDQNKNSLEQSHEFSDARKVHFEQNILSVHTCKNTLRDKSPQFVTKMESRPSCKCLMHENREDYYRFKNQCLLGKGDEMNNSFVKYVKEKENNPSHDSHNDQHIVPDEIDSNNCSTIGLADEKTYEPSEVNMQQDSINKPEYQYTKNHLKSDSIEHLKETCSNKCVLSSINDGPFKGKDKKVLAENACSKSLSYCLDSLPNVKNAKERNITDNGKFSEINRYNRDKGTSCHKYNVSLENHKRPCCNGVIPTHLLNKNNTELKESNHKDYNVFKEYSFVDRERKNIQEESIDDCCVDFTNRSTEIDNLSRDTSLNDGVDNKTYLKSNNNKCCLEGCDCGKSAKPKSNIRTIVFRIGSSKNTFSICSNQSLTKKSPKLKSLRPKGLHRKISAVFKGNQTSNGESVRLIYKNKNTENTTNNSSVGVESFINKTNTKTSSWTTCDYSTVSDSFPSTTKGTPETFTQNSVIPESYLLTADALGTLVSELKHQQMEINYMKKLLENHIM